MSRSVRLAYVELATAMLIVGSITVVSKVMTSTFTVFLAAAMRFAIASAILLPLLLKTAHGLPRVRKKDAGVLFLQAFAGNFLFSIFLLQEPVMWSYGVGILAVLVAIALMGRNTDGTDKKGESETRVKEEEYLHTFPQ